jgi:8-oxo-dGTP pyrophosphatase MutT (NUDIX family)
MVVRHHQIDFASGALVFPGGKAAPGDNDPRLRERCHGADGLTDRQISLRACAIREAFEECGVLLARKAGETDLVGPDVVAKYDSWRPSLDRGETAIMELLEEADLYLALDALVPYAHWITPEMMPKRFDTYFYLAIAPSDQLALHDGREHVDSAWLNPATALKEMEEGKWTIIFPTRLNIEKLAPATSAADAIARAKADDIKSVTPELVKTDDGLMLRIRDDAGYETTEEPMESAIPK